MSYSFTASSGLDTVEIVNAINALIDAEIMTRTSTITEGSCITFVFSDVLSESNVSKLTTFCQVLVDVSKPRKKLFNVFPKNESTNTTSYSLMGRCAYKVLIDGQCLDYIDVMSKMDTATSYSIKIINVSDKSTIASRSNLTNTEFESIDLGYITNMPTSDTILEIYAKVEGIGSVYIDQLQIYYS